MTISPSKGGASASEYTDTWDAWHARRVEELRNPYGWLSITSIQWLSEGPASSIKELPGTFQLKKGGLLYTPDETANVELTDGYAASDGQLPSRRAVTGPELLAPEVDLGSPRLIYGDVQVEVILRDGRYALRVRDPASGALRRLREIDHYEPDPSWVVPASFERFETLGEEVLPSARDSLTHYKKVLGLVHFEVGGVPQTLEAYEADVSVATETLNDSERLNGLYAGSYLVYDHLPTLIFADATSGHETFGGSRFIYLGNDLDELSEIDFNRAVNPPCALMGGLCTCPFVTPQNRLTAPITAGEKTIVL